MNNRRRTCNKIFEKLEIHRLAPTPENYRIWYEYDNGNIDELVTEIDRLLSEQMNIDERLCRQIYKTYLYTNNQQQADMTFLAMNDLLKIVISLLGDMDSSTSQFCNALTRCIERLDADPGALEVKNIIETVSQEAKNVREATVNINQNLSSLTEEIDALRDKVERLGHESITDNLTQLMNRRGFDDSIIAIVDKAKEEHSNVTLLMADVDNFKRINDGFGHLTGDKVLRFISTVIRKTVRNSDVVARYGGEEFAVILPCTSLKTGMHVAEKIRKAIGERELSVGSGQQKIGRISISIGISQYLFNEPLNTFIQRTDKLMYQAKSSGRNQVIGDLN
ncbi:MAG: diguanylate cyclase [Oceanicoccus sp.]|jgi:diguanylate cyclase